MTQADIGVIGLAVMGQNLVLNMNDHGFVVAVFNRTVSKVDDFMQGPAKNSQIIGTKSLKEFFQVLKRPRKVLLMVKAGDAVDEFISHCLPFMEPGDILIDGGNSHYPDTNRRCALLAQKGMFFIGAGVSGGEEGARHGPSIMPGGHEKAWPHVKPIFQAIAAKVEDGSPCCEWVGEGGSGHYVKMVHNGIEYGDMQLICETYQLLKTALSVSSDALSAIFADWNAGELNSYLIEITAEILKRKESDGSPLVDHILDVAGQKGTGKWTVVDALNLGQPLTLISEAVFARCLSALKEQRVEASKQLPAPSFVFEDSREELIEHVRQALYASKIISYAQGFMLMKQAAKEYGWKLNYGAIALMWRGGCIIRSRFLGKIKEAYDLQPNLENLLLDPFFIAAIQETQAGWRHVVATAAQMGIPIPCLSSGLAFYDGYRTAQLPINLLQAQRDYFGAHQYERTDQPRGTFFHTDWTGSGGKAFSGAYSA